VIRLRRTKNKIRRRTAALALLADRPPGRVLDAPCGDGALARELAARGWRTWAADIAPVRLDGAAGVRHLRLDLETPLPFADHAFDAVVSLEGVEHLLLPARCLAEFCRVLRPGGTLLLTIPNINTVQSRWHYLVGGRFSGFRPITRRTLATADGATVGHVTTEDEAPVAHVTPPYLPTLVYTLGRHGVAVDTIDVTMIRTRQWLALPLAVVLWLSARRAPAGTVARALGSFTLLLGRNVILRGVKRSAAPADDRGETAAPRATARGSG
jgi:SAM-dependent methyltransferase